MVWARCNELQRSYRSYRSCERSAKASTAQGVQGFEHTLSAREPCGRDFGWIGIEIGQNGIMLPHDIIWHHMASYGIIVQVHGTINWTSWACLEIFLVIACKRAHRVAFHCQFSTRWFCYANASAHVRKPSTAPHPWSYEMLDSLNALVQRFRFSFQTPSAKGLKSHRNGFKMV